MSGDKIKFITDKLFKGGILLLVALVLMFILPLILSLISWRNNIYTLNKDSIKFETGIINKKIREVPLKNISTVDVSQGIISRIFGVATLKLDTEETKSNEEEGKIFAKIYKINEVKKYIQDFKGDTRDENIVEDEYIIHPRNLILYSLNFKILGLLLGFYYSINKIFEKILGEIKLDWIEEKIESSILSMGVIVVLALILIIFIIGYLLSIVANYIKYHKFKLKISKDLLCITYGLINKQEYSISKNNIKAIYLEENLLAQIFKKTSVKVEVIGYGDEDKEVALLHPMIDKNLALALIRDNFPYLYFEGDVEKSPKYSKLRYFIPDIVFYICTNIFTIIVYDYLKISAVVSSYLMLKIILVIEFIYLIVKLISCNLEYNNNAVAMDENKVYISSGGYNKKISFIRKKAVQSVNYRQTIFQKRKNLMNIIVRIHSNKFNEIKVRQLNKNYKKIFHIK